MSIEARRFAAWVLDGDGRSLGEARVWVATEWAAEGSSWRGWLRVADLENPALPGGPLRLRLADGVEGAFEPAGRPSRVFEQELLPIVGIGAPPWSEGAPPTARYRPVWNETPPRMADDRPALNRLAGVIAATPEQIATIPYLDHVESERSGRHQREPLPDPDLLEEPSGAWENPTPDAVPAPDGAR